MGRIFSFLVGLALILSTTISASAGDRHKTHHRHHHIHTVSHGGISAGISFRAQVYARPQVVVDRPKLAGPVIYYRKVRVIRTIKGCTVKQASAIARDFGIRYQTIIRSPRTMTVVGYRHGKKAKICLSRAPGCAILD